jgi:U4/U6 small nuclear ribonucleoprotein PRP31
MVVTVTATTTSGRPLSPDALAKALEGCDMMMALDADKSKVGGVRGGGSGGQRFGCG